MKRTQGPEDSPASVAKRRHLTKTRTIREQRLQQKRLYNMQRNNTSQQPTTSTASEVPVDQDNAEHTSRMSMAERQRACRNRRKSEQSIQVQTNPTESINNKQIWETRWQRSNARFNLIFYDNPFGYNCSICDRLWFRKDLTKVTGKHVGVITNWYNTNNILLTRETLETIKSSYTMCNTCKSSLSRGKMPTLATLNGFKYPAIPANLPALDPVSERLISPRLPFMQIRRLRYDFGFGIIGQVINVPVSVPDMVSCLPRQLDEDNTINVNIKRNLVHKSVYLSGYVKKRTICAWLQELQKSTLYRLYNIEVNMTRLNSNSSQSDDHENRGNPGTIEEPIHIEDLNADAGPESEVLAARQHTMIWNEDKCLNIAPGQRATPLNIIYDKHAEELSFPSIYYGEPRQFNMNISVTPYMIATSEIRRKDRRGATPQKVLYVAMKILRYRMVESIRNTFRCVQNTENVTRRMLEDKNFLETCLEKNLAFLKSVPNSVQYWSARKADLFAIIRQLGKPTVFLTVSANEIKWPVLLNMLNTLSERFPGIDAERLTRTQRCALVNEDPITCCIYFHKLLDSFMGILKSTNHYNPFGRFRVLDYFIRIEFQHRGSPHAHTLLWLDNDPKETISEEMPMTIELIESLCSVSVEDVPDEHIYNNQVHKHTFTCYKRGEISCRFGIPYWPMESTRVLLPMAQTDSRRKHLQSKAKHLREKLEQRSYITIADFLTDNNLTQLSYLDLIRSTLRRPTILFRRNMQQLNTNTFNPWIAGVLASNMDLQFILDEYSCAAYVVEYVNKSARGMGNLHRGLIKLMEEHPECDYTGHLKALAVKLLNAVEMSAQEAAWFLLRQPMSESSRAVAYIPTVWPHERQKSRKQHQQMDKEGIDADSTDIWTKNIIQRYEERPNELEPVYLAEFVAWYASKYDCVDEEALAEDNAHINNEDEIRVRAPRRVQSKYRKRSQARVIRYRHYDIDDTLNYKREMILLYLPFRCELAEIVDRNKFINLYDTNEEVIMQRRRLYEANIDINAVMTEIAALCILDERENNCVNERVSEMETRSEFVAQLLQHNEAENIDDIQNIGAGNGISAVRRRTNVMPKQQYCELMRSTNGEQRELILEAIHRMHIGDKEPLQVFFTGPAGCGKSYTLKLLMETYNRFSQQHNSLRNAYVACASTGKAAVAIGGTTVHSAFHLSLSRKTTSLSTEVLHGFRNMFVGVKCIIIDEISMLSSAILHKTNVRLQQITSVFDKPFGGLDIYLCGDFRQLPPVRATPCYTMPTDQLGGPVLWQSVEYFPLSRVVRQSDNKFSALLTKVGNGEPLNDEEIQMIESRHKSTTWCNTEVPNAIRLFFCNRDVDEYNRNCITNALQCNAVDIIVGYTTITERNECRGKLHRLTVAECDGLPYTIPLALGYPYMITANIDIADGLVNGSIGTLRYIEKLNPNDDEILQHDVAVPGPSNWNGDRDSNRMQNHLTLWFEFQNESVGRYAKVKCRPHIHCKPELSTNWVPINQRIVNIGLTKTVKCKRKQFPLTPACAITIHKSQGGTFNEIVYKYSTRQPQQLVYVALSRVTSVDGLYIITDNDVPFRFTHGRQGSDAPAIRGIRDEFKRLEQHILPTVTKAAHTFCNSTIYNLIVNFNVQSLRAHSVDVETDSVMQRCDYLALTETWMRDDEEPMSICNYKCVGRINNRSSTTNAAGGVAIYRKISAKSNCRYVKANNSTNTGSFGDVCLIDIINPEGEINVKFVLGSIYIHPGTSAQNIGDLLNQILVEYIQNPEIPLMLCGDFNVNVMNSSEFISFMKDKFNLDCVSNTRVGTTIGGTCIDLTFARHIAAETFNYISYFSYHRPIIVRVD